MSAVNVSPEGRAERKTVSLEEWPERCYTMLQSCSDEILRRINRRHNVDRLREINRLAGDDVHLVFQLILGFPGETDELFQETVPRLILTVV